MHSIFHPDNPVVRFFVKLSYLWVLNILWLVTSLPVFTIGASTTALLYAAQKLLRDEGTPAKNFFKSFRENFRQSTAIFLLYLGVGALLALDLVYWNRQGRSGDGINVPGALSLAVCILYGISFSYVFAIQSRFVNTVGNTIRYALILPFHHMKETFLIALTLAAVGYLNVAFSAAVNFVTVNFGVGLIAYLFAVFFSNIFAPYCRVEEPTADENYTASRDGDPAFEEALAGILARNEEDARIEKAQQRHGSMA